MTLIPVRPELNSALDFMARGILCGECPFQDYRVLRSTFGMSIASRCAVLWRWAQMYPEEFERLRRQLAFGRVQWGRLF